MENTSADQFPFFKATRPAAIRIWHWLAFLFFAASITTVILNSTLFKMRNNIDMVQEQVKDKGGSITPLQARAVAHEYSDKLWTVHKFIGFGLCLLLLFRVITEIVISKEKKLGSKISKAMRFPAGTSQKSHYLFAEFGYLFFYLIFILMALTGLVLAFEDVSWLDPIHKTAKNIHEFLQYAFYTYIVAHIAGVIRADLTQHSGIVSRMINGKINPAND